MRSKPHIAAGPPSDSLPASDRLNHRGPYRRPDGRSHSLLADPTRDLPETRRRHQPTPGIRRARHRRRRHASGPQRHPRRQPERAVHGVLLAVTALGWVALHGGAAATIGSSDTAARWSQERALALGLAGQCGHTGAAGFFGHGKRAGHLPAATTTPAAAPASLAAAPPLRPHEVFGFAPYWTLPSSAGFDVQGISTLAYFSVGVNPDGTLLESGPGWNGYESQSLANLITRAHAANDRVVLTVTDFSQSSLNALTSSPTAATDARLPLGQRRLGQEPRRSQPRPRGRGFRRPGRADAPRRDGVVRVAPGQSALSGDHGHLRQFGHRLGRLLRHSRA